MVKGDSGEGPERKNKYRESFHFLTEHLNNPDQKAVWNMDGIPHVTMRNILLESEEKVILIMK